MNIQKLMQSAQAMQARLEKIQKDLAETEVTGSSGGGAVNILMTCRGIARKLEIDTSLINADEKEMLEDMIVAAINDARAKADAKVNTETQQAMKDFGLPEGAKLPGM